MRWPLIACFALTASGLAAVALADQPLAVGGSGAPDASANAAPRPLGSSDGPRADDFASPDPCGPSPGGDDPADPKAATRAHGEVGAAVGAGGYRSVHAVVCKPLGARGAAVLAIDAARLGGHPRWRGR